MNHFSRLLEEAGSVGLSQSLRKDRGQRLDHLTSCKDEQNFPRGNPY